MIKKLILNNVATYCPNGAELGDLEKINFIYGSNGSGKTTISEVIRNPQLYGDCEIVWQETPYKAQVYNRNFIKENFRDDSRIKGIFTLGKESAELLEEIEQRRIAIRKIDDDIKGLNNQLKLQQDNQSENTDKFREHCWRLKTKYDTEFKEAFEGLRNSREKFMERCINEAMSNNCELVTIEDLRKRKESIFGKQLQYLDPLSPIVFEDNFHDEKILTTKIIGKEDVDIASLITRLKISDWVQQGHKHTKDTEGLCPFCQQQLPVDFNEKLSEYFNETFTEQIRELEMIPNQYKQSFGRFFQEIDAIKSNQNQYFDFNRIAPIMQVIESQFNENKILIDQKIKEPSRGISISSVQHYINEINEEITNSNKLIQEHNELLKNLKLEKSNLVQDIWRFIAEENKTNFVSFNQESTRLEKAITGIKGAIKKKSGFRKLEEDANIENEQKITSITHSINEINRILSSFGFKNFKLADGGKGNYKIIREDGQDAEATLSEGEKTFITFLYFYQLIKGNDSKEQITADKIVVIDDPISSLDSNVLFIVSSLIRKIIDEIRENPRSNFKQLIILTHNVYFHKEVSFNKGKGSNKLKEETFWIVRKINNESHITRYSENPIKTSYELLWKELNYIKDENLITAQNVMRRILENYFRFFGNINIEAEIDKFAEEDRFVCQSLLSWANDGSHHINEDLFVEISPEQTERFLEVFKNIFYNMGHGSHYEMMMVGYEKQSLASEKELV
ncbi:wobble nucleotide-excising tRNase [Neobacillus niacini]|uniref:AAA family ATPase n=1 Tax=Neobacillus niacini TaxID=86668 RepID=UPI00277F6777|nr:AAA family ATPase [Neobacillus niacini]MDQ1005437.1 wobble nucleotide-excising tRNase [Neobacillus niacini]